MGFHHNNMHKKTKTNKGKFRVRVTMLGVAIVFAVATIVQLSPWQATSIVKADEISELQKKIDELQGKANEYTAKAKDLSAKGDTYENKIADLKNQQSALQVQIDLYGAKKQQLDDKIAENEQSLKTQLDALGKNLENMYYSNQTSGLDILMNSNNVSDYVDKQVRQSAANDNIQKRAEQAKSTKAQLEEQRQEVNKVINQQNSAKQSLADNQAEQQKLLDETRGEESEYKKKTESTQKEMAQVQAQRQAAIQRIIDESRTGGGNGGTNTGGGKKPPVHQITSSSKCGGGYPLCNAVPDSSVTDPVTGFSSNGNARECVSYVQWRIYQITGKIEKHGMYAYMWPTNLGKNPVVGSAAVMGTNIIPVSGHIAWVEEVGTGSRAGQVKVSQYNWNPAYGYSTEWVSISQYKGFYKNW